MEYNECAVYSILYRKKQPLISEVPLDEFTQMAQKNFDYEFDGKSKFYPFELPSLPSDFGIVCIVGASGSGKSTLLNEFVGGGEYSLGNSKTFDDRAIISNFDTPNEAVERLSAVGLNSIPTWCRPRKVLSIGEGFRSDVALNLRSYTIFDEFTSTIDRNVAKSTCKGIQKYIRNNGLKNVVFCSCHKDFIPYLCPDLVIDCDEEKVFDCRGADLKKAYPYKFTNPIEKTCGEYLGSIII